MITGKKTCVATIKDVFIRQCRISNKVSLYNMFYKVIIHRVDFLVNGEWFLNLNI
jgi:hypothetical protein